MTSLDDDSLAMHSSLCNKTPSLLQALWSGQKHRFQQFRFNQDGGVLTFVVEWLIASVL